MVIATQLHAQEAHQEKIETLQFLTTYEKTLISYILHSLSINDMCDLMAESADRIRDDIKALYIKLNAYLYSHLDPEEVNSDFRYSKKKKRRFQ